MIMKNRIGLLVLSAFVLAAIAPVAAAQSGSSAASSPAASSPIVVTVDATKLSAPISKYELGMFIEHIGQLVYRSLWSEMLDDRKFYFPVSPKPAEPPANPMARSLRMFLRNWNPIGPEQAVTMDQAAAYVGEHSPRIQVAPGEPRGISQSGLTLRKGKSYVGRIVLASSPGVKVKVALVWGPGPADRQTVALGATPSSYAKLPLRFWAQGDSDDGRFEITGTGNGAFHVGAVSLMPADNVQGFRPDTIALLQKLHSGFWRLPGGNFVSDWSWYDSVGDPDKRPPVFDYAWNAVQSNDVGMDEWMTFCKLIGVEPYITVNAGFGDAHSAGEEVEYMNGSTETRLGALRAKNGHPEPYHVRFWNIGNEPYGRWELGRTDLKYYVFKHNEFAAAMRKADPSITLIASGSMLEAMNLIGESRAKFVDNLKGLEGTEDDWTGGLLAHCWGNFDGITEHWYAQPGRRFDLALAKTLPLDAPTDAGYDKIDQTPLEYARYPANIVHLKAQEWEGYRQRFPAMLDKKTFLSIDEYAYFGGGFTRPPDLKLALAYAMIFDEMLRHTGFLTMSAHTMGVSTLDMNQTASTFNTTGLVFQLYGDHFPPGSLPVALSGTSPQPAPQFPIGGDQPNTNSGSPTYPLDMFAALTPDHKFLTLAIVNATESEQKFDLSVTGARLAGAGKLWQMTGSSLDAANRVGQPPQVNISETSLGSGAKSLSVPPFSISMVQFPVD